MKIRENVPISQLCTFQNEGTVRHVIVFETAAEVQDFVTARTDAFYVLGKGSNTVIDPENPIQTFVQISPELIPIHHDGEIVMVSAGTRVNQLVKYGIAHGLGGFEFAAGVPASIGGMVCMNFGCWGKELADMLVSIEVVDEKGLIREFAVKDLEMAYRSSRLMREKWIVLSAKLRFSQMDPSAVQEKSDAAIQTRLDKQPLRARTFGSTYKNPPNDFAARLIESVGLKGLEHDGVKISEKHANFMVNTGGATFSALAAMLNRIETAVADRYDIQLMREVRLVSV